MEDDKRRGIDLSRFARAFRGFTHRVATPPLPISNDGKPYLYLDLSQIALTEYPLDDEHSSVPLLPDGQIARIQQVVGISMLGMGFPIEEGGTPPIHGEVSNILSALNLNPQSAGEALYSIVYIGTMANFQKIKSQELPVQQKDQQLTQGRKLVAKLEYELQRSKNYRLSREEMMATRQAIEEAFQANPKVLG